MVNQVTPETMRPGVPDPRADTPWQPASRRELIALLLFFVLLIALSDAANVRLGVEAMTVAVLLAATLITHAPGGFLRDWWFYLLGLLLWNLSGPIAAQSTFPLHLDFMLRADRLLFFGHDPVVILQHALANPRRADFLGWLAVISYNVHLQEPYIAGYFLWRLNRAVYMQFAAATLSLVVAAFVLFILFPAVPPWMASTRYARLPHVYNAFGAILRHHPLPFHGTPLFQFFRWKGDAVAAFPSQHAAFPFLEMLAFARISVRGWWLALWVAWILFVIVYLGEHWVVDALAGWAMAAAVFYGVLRVTSGRRANDLSPESRSPLPGLPR